ncbi:MAG: hypothetical protein ACK5MD_02505 [Flavobacteriales bacterium]
MDTVFAESIYKEEGEGVRVRFKKSEVSATPSGCEFMIKIIDNKYDEYPRIHLDAKGARKLALEILGMLDCHKELLKEDFKESC